MEQDIYSLELRISKFLRVGVMLAGLTMALGVMLTLLQHGNSLHLFETYQTESLSVSLSKGREQQNWGLLLSYLGLFILISLPILRVLLTSLLFFKQNEKLLGSIALFVFTILIISFSLGIEL